MKKGVLITIFLSIQISINAQQMRGKEYNEMVKFHDSLKKEDLKELSEEIEKYLKSNLSDKKFKGFYVLEKYNQNYHYYPLIRRFSDTLAPELFKYYRFSQTTRKGLGLLELPQFMRDSLLTYGKTEGYIRAALGDSISEKRIISRFEKINAKDINTKEVSDLYNDLALSLLYINSKNTIEVFMKGMESSKVDSDIENNLPEESKYRKARFASLLGLYYSVYKYEYVTSYWYRSRFFGLKTRTKEMDRYFEEVESHFYRKYGIKIKISAPFLEYGEIEWIEHDIIDNPNKN